MTPHQARTLLTAFARGRDEWLTKTAATLDADGVWLVGSLATGSADDWSDLDLIVVNGAPALDGALLTIDMPANGPAGGGYLGAMYDVAGLPLWVDWYLWPPDADLPAEARQLARRDAAEVAASTIPGGRSFSDTLDHIGRGPSRPRTVSTSCPGPPPDPTEFTLAMLPLAAKHLARGNHDTATSITTMLGAQAGTPLLDVLAGLDAIHPAAALVHRHLTVVNALRSARD